MLVYSKHLDGRFTPDGRDDTVIVVANVDPHSVRETTVHLDLAAIGLDPRHPLRGRGPRDRASLGLGRRQLRAPRRVHATRAHPPRRARHAMTDRMPPAGPAVDDAVLAAVAEGRHSDPHSVLGQHGFDVPRRAGPHTVIRTRRPLADRVEAVLDDGDVLRARARRARDLGGLRRVRARRLPRPGALRRRPSGRATTPTGSRRRSASSTCTSSARAGTSSSGRCSAPTTASTGARGRRARHRVHRLGAARPRRAGGRRVQPLGRRRPRDAQHGRRRASGSCSCPTSSPARSTSSRSSPARAPGS